MRTCQSKGHSLLEMILASFLLATVAVGILSIWTMQDKAIKKTGHVMVAQYLGERLIEECLAAGYDGVLTMANTFNGTNTGVPTVPMEMFETVTDKVDQGVLRSIIYTGTIDVTDIATINNTRLVVVTVDWDGNVGRSSLDYRSYIQEKG